MRTISLVIAVTLLLSVAYAQPKAWRTVNFGMTPADVTAALATYDDVDLDWLDESSIASTYPVWATLADLKVTVRFFFHDDALMRVLIASAPTTAYNFQGVVENARATLLSVITTASGAPTMSRDVTFLDVEPQTFTWTNTWVTDAAGINRYVGIDMLDSRYSAALIIDDAARIAASGAAQQAEQRNAVDDAASDF